MCTVKLSFTCLNILSEVNIPKAAVCWLRVNAKARGEEKGRVKWDGTYLSQDTSPPTVSGQVSQIPKSGGLLLFPGSQVISWLCPKTD